MTLKAMIRLVCLMVVLPLLFSSCGPDLNYSIETRLNPYKISPLTAILNIEAEKPCDVTIKVLGRSPVEQTFELNSTNLEIPVLGLYPNRENNVLVTLDFEGGHLTDTIKIKTGNTPAHFPRIAINKLNRNQMAPGMHGCDIHFANNGKFRSEPLIFDDQGQVRWYLDLGFAGKMVSPFQRLKDGTLLMVSRNVIYEFNMLGKLLKKTKINPNYGMHHDVLELPDGNLLICVGKKGNYIEVNGESVMSDSDFIILFDRKKSVITKEWDLAKHLDVSRSELNFFRPGDWLHMNGLAYDPRDNSIIVSGKNQGLINITWDDTLQWIIAPKKHWGKSGRDGKGFDVNPYLLTAVDAKGKSFSNAVQEGSESIDQFDFSWGMHAPLQMPNGNLMAFDNGPKRNFENILHYSRAVEYKINKEEGTVEQVWQYGKERSQEFFSPIVSDVDYLDKSNTILVTSGFIKTATSHTAKIVEVDYETRKEVFEATLYFKNKNGDRSNNWGQSDILYRSERMELK